MLAILEAARDLVVIVIFSLFGSGDDGAPQQPDTEPEGHMLERLVR